MCVCYGVRLAKIVKKNANQSVVWKKVDKFNKCGLQL